jgi:hypothetical protein
MTRRNRTPGRPNRVRSGLESAGFHQEPKEQQALELADLPTACDRRDAGQVGRQIAGFGRLQAFRNQHAIRRSWAVTAACMFGSCWLQIANFIVSGALFVACAVGLRRALRSGRGGKWGPRLIGALGIGLIVSGVFTADAGAGFPPGAPAGAPEISWRGALHELGFIVAMLSGTVACFVFARRFASSRDRAWTAACIAAPLVALALSFWPDLNGMSVRLVVATAIQFGLVAAVAARVRAELSDAGTTPTFEERKINVGDLA